jgi:hypothetical protein
MPFGVGERIVEIHTPVSGAVADRMEFPGLDPASQRAPARATLMAGIVYRHGAFRFGHGHRSSFLFTLPPRSEKK